MNNQSLFLITSNVQVSATVKLIGNYNTDTTIDITNYKKDISSYLIVTKAGSYSSSRSHGSYGAETHPSIGVTFVPAQATINGNSLKIQAPRATASEGYPYGGSWSCICPYSVYHIDN